LIALWAIGAAAALLQAYVLYPLSLLLKRRLPAGRAERDPAVWPTITLLISAYNEERTLRRKLENVATLDYPRDRLRTIVVSDGSTDATEAIAAGFAPAGIELASFAGRQGKVACLNLVLPRVTSDLVVMSDANSMYESSSLKRLARHFEAEEVGCVCGELLYENPERLSSGVGERAYWDYERWVKRVEGSRGILLGANGAIYAYRRALFEPVDPRMFCDDVIPIRIRIAGHLVLYEPQARCAEEAVGEQTELRRRRRHASFGMRSMLAMVREAMRRGRPLVAYQAVSHRILRWFGGVWLLLILIGTPWLPTPFRMMVAWGQGMLYGAALLGFVLDRMGIRVTILYLPYYAMALTAAGMAGLCNLVLDTDRPFWEPRQ
jgi:cellulose synthase/poly-beta-1,6-N-acetylglucosamine synthase-like glycosyltransferase